MEPLEKAYPLDTRVTLYDPYPVRKSACFLPSALVQLAQDLDGCTLTLQQFLDRFLPVAVKAGGTIILDREHYTINYRVARKQTLLADTQTREVAAGNHYCLAKYLPFDE